MSYNDWMLGLLGVVVDKINKAKGYSDVNKVIAATPAAIRNLPKTAAEVKPDNKASIMFHYLPVSASLGENIKNIQKELAKVSINELVGMYYF